MAIFLFILPIVYYISIIFKSQITDLQFFLQYIFYNLYDNNPAVKTISDQIGLKEFVLIGEWKGNISPYSKIQIGPRSTVLYGDEPHYVTLTFYIQKESTEHVRGILTNLLSHHIDKAVFFIEKKFENNHPLIGEIIKRSGYKVYPWRNTTQYDRNYAPTVFHGISLTDREIVPRAYEGIDVTSLFDIALHNQNESIIAFTPQMAPKFLFFDTLLKHITENNNGTLIFTDNSKHNGSNVFNSSYPNKGLMNIGHSIGHGLSPNFDSNPNPATDVIITGGNWTIATLQTLYPSKINYLQSQNAFLIHDSLVISNHSRLNITNSKVFIRTSIENSTFPVRLDVRDESSATILNSTITSWDPALKSSDPNPYHPRPYLVAQNGGKMDIINSTISYLGFPLGGIDDTRSARSAINYFNTSNFQITNSTIAFNYYGFYSSQASNYTITGNNIYGSVKYGLDPHSGSRNFLISHNYIHDNGKQGFICSKYCKDIFITYNILENNMEGIGLHWSSNSSLIKNNIVRNNEKHGIYMDKFSSNNTIQNNTSIGNMFGIGLLDRSENNNLINNSFTGNRISALDIDGSSRSNFIKDN